MVLYFKHLHHPTIINEDIRLVPNFTKMDGAMALGLPSTQDRGRFLEQYNKEEIVLLAIVKKTPLKHEYLGPYQGKIFACCTLKKNTPPIALSTSYQNRYEAVKDKWLENIPIENYWAFHPEDFIDYAQYEIVPEAQAKRGQIIRLSGGIEKLISADLTKVRSRENRSPKDKKKILNSLLEVLDNKT